MLFRRERPKKIAFDENVRKLRDAGFQSTPLGSGRVKVIRNGIAAVIEDGVEKPRVREEAGVVLGDEIGTLVDGGFQKFFQTKSGVRKPAVATELKAIHEFQEDLREVLGLTSLYNEALGSVSNIYLYDRVKDREADQPKKPWELQARGEDSVAKV